MPKSRFMVGDCVELTEEGYMTDSLFPAKLVRIGNLPNLFHVKQVFQVSAGECIMLEECCGKELPFTSLHCSGHPAHFFRRVPDLERIS